MSYQVLARKYRPHRFDQMVGQTATLQALQNALSHNKIHHAYLLTGSRGVGKTSLARLFAKCVNCMAQLGPKACESCEHCLAFKENRFIDLIEIDAASRTRVEDIHELLENVQYKPSLGRYKVYLIDEVHMLSIHSFNALLKTLEEPPSYVIFILATTDPNRLPDTILSRCLRFHLKNLTSEQITQQLATILEQENIHYETKALSRIAQAGKGSVRDALSLLEPVILYNDTTKVTMADVEAVLGYSTEEEQIALIKAIHYRKPDQLLKLVEKFTETNVDFEEVLIELLNYLHKMSMMQFVKGVEIEVPSELKTLAQEIDHEQIQLYYQIALIGRRDLSLSPTPRLGFEMTVLRMLAFQPTSMPLAINNSEEKHEEIATEQADDANVSIEEEKKLTETSYASIDWSNLMTQLPLNGFLKSFASHCQLTHYEGDHIRLQLDPSQGVLYSKERENLLREILSKYLNKSIHLHISIGKTKLITPASLEADKQRNARQIANEAMLKDPGVQTIIKQFDATIQPDSFYLKNGETYE